MSHSSESVFSKYYNFFNPNICHVCKMPQQINEIFITCGQCRMISYCSMDHKLKNNECHMQICTALRNISKSHQQFWYTCGIALKEWIQTRKLLKYLVQMELQRDLQPYEEQMITLAKSCIICYRQDNLLQCQKCHSINYCNNHKELLGNRHSSNCDKLKLCLWTNTFMTLHPIIIDRFIEFPNDAQPANNMDAFIDKFVFSKHWKDKSYTVWYNLCLYYSDYASGPLTLYYGIRKLHGLDCFHKLDSHFVIHIIDPKLIDIEYLPAWELLVHLLPNVKELKIILIGSILSNKSESLTLCTIRCFRQNLNIETHRMLYHNYVDSECYKRPDVIIGFQVDFTDWETLPQIILKIKHQQCPLLLTAKSQHKAQQNLEKISSILQPVCNVLYLLYHGENNFKSKRPYVDFEDGDASYRNDYLNVFRRL
ncbi:uncharacterized protein LOC116844127 [Odontomachus brunneus]|uniref:uncharacterized protein LOC116844127 n=1 Tax=Odontomachus brunneus TaxID=486640 RepID=UPI0013F1DFEE|nr:uncharacterized protein LOC116844127 [Odontomachus brunneus]